MFELLRGLFNLLGLLYWVLAIVVLAFVIYKGKKLWIKFVGAVVVIGLFGWLPVRQGVEDYQRNAFAKEAWTYFRKLCDERAGHKIYKTFTAVKSVVVLKPLPPATEKDLYDQYWYGDPYSNATSRRERGEAAALKLMGVFEFNGLAAGAPSGKQIGFQFVEYPSEEAGKSFYILRRAKNYPYMTSEATKRVSSRFGVSWEDISTPEDRKYWIAGSRLRVIDLTDQSIIAERVGYLIEPGFGSGGGGRRPWSNARGGRTTCPPLQNGDFEDRWFVLRVLIPEQGAENGK